MGSILAKVHVEGVVWKESVSSAIFVKKMVWGNGEAIEEVEMDDPFSFYPLIRFYL